MTTVALSPLRKQGDVSRIPAAPTAVLLQGSGTSLTDTLAPSYTPIVHLDPLLESIKGRSRAFMREGRAGERANEQAHSLSLANACNPYYEHTPLVRDNTSRVSPLCSILRQPIWAGARNDKFTRRSRDPSWSKRRQLARQVEAYNVLTNNFPLSSRWVVYNNLFSPGRCSTSGVSSSCPLTAATTWYSSPRSATATTTVVSSPGGGELDDVSPHGGRAASGFVPPPSSPQEEEAGQPWPGRRRHLVGYRTSRRRRHPSGEHVGRYPRT
jgi:hypothetical protein